MPDIDRLIAEMTLEEKASLCSGLDFWNTKPAERLGIPSVMVSDGPNGLRMQSSTGSDHLGLGESDKAVCYPTGSALGSSFDCGIAYELGKHLGNAARGKGLHTLLGPAVNMKRSPLCGRNFEYLSEDPLLAGELAASYSRGVQDEGVGVCVKHFAANNQEYCRMSTDTIVSERALREIYLKAFEIVVRKAHPWSIMCAYNRINGTYCCENRWLLDDVLRKQWGFDGIVMTDWGAMNDRVSALLAGLELEMPSSFGVRDKEIVRAVEEGRLDLCVLDESVRRILKWVFRKGNADGCLYTLEEQHSFAKRLAEECAVLLKNDGDILPLPKDRKIAFIGSFAKFPRYQGGGSSHVNSYKVSSALDEAFLYCDVTYEAGWCDDGMTRDQDLLDKAVEAGAAADVAVVFAGLPDSYESEGFDRKHINLPDCQNELIMKLAEMQKNIVVVLHNGSPVSMPWVDRVPSILEMNLAGEAVGEATAELLFGIADPSGHLSETYPLRLEDNPSYLSFPGSGKKVVYREDVFIGYRWYDSSGLPVLFPFGHGLSYTSFEIKNARIDGDTVSAEVCNTGKRAGSQVVQLYIRPPKASEDRPRHELKAFRKIRLDSGASCTVSFTISDEMLSYFDEGRMKWSYAGGTYTAEIGFSSRDILAELEFEKPKESEAFRYSDDVTVNDVIAAGLYGRLPQYIAEVGRHFGVGSGNESAAMGNEASSSIFHEMPLHSIASFIKVSDDFIEDLKERLGH